ncbi:MAG: hypothetical protein CMJ18_06780 [Phycisphaeraceae bacterium]|nr:hypothetical protein [Phycisphaeraceae bacterium]
MLDRVVVAIALAWATGIILARWSPSVTACAIAGAGLLVLAGALRIGRRAEPARVVAVLAIVAAGAGWTTLRGHHVSAHHVSRFLGDRQLARVTGRIVTPPLTRPAQRGRFASYSHEAPMTTAILDVGTIMFEARFVPCTGRLRLKIAEAEHRLRAGMRIEATGWLAPFAAPDNPGTPDIRPLMRRRGIEGRLTLPLRANWRPLGSPPHVMAWRHALQSRVANALRDGMVPDAPRLALLDTILLGRRGSDPGAADDDFRRVGLAHVLSISGAHLGILLGIVWIGAQWVTGRPRITAACMLIALALFLLVVPWRVPIARAAIMSGLLGAAYGSGRRIEARTTLLVAALIILIWRPMELFEAGFQLSFGAVAGLLLFTNRARPDPFEAALDPRGHWTHRRPMIAALWRYGWFNLVAFAVTLPVAAYHFQRISPFAVVVTMAALPLVSIVLGLGYTKIALGLAYPSVGAALAAPLEGATDLLLALVSRGAALPGASLELQRAPPVTWVVATLALILIALGTRPLRHRKSWIAAMIACAAWLVVSAAPARLPLDRVGAVDPPPFRLDMLAVGDGSCYVLRLARAPRRRPFVLMFDCGSQDDLNLANRTVVPALRHLGIARIDLLMLSHADLDHYGGTLDLIDAVPVELVVMPSHLQAEANRDDASAAAFLLQSLRARRARITRADRGWQRAIGASILDLLWPPRDLDARRRNDTSLVLRVRTAGRRVMLNGDIQNDAITRLLDLEDDLRADVCDLPHHGSFVDTSPRWLDAVNPRVVLQSCGRGRMDRDRWAPWLSSRGIRRYATARHGMVTVVIDRHGDVATKTFRRE